MTVATILQRHSVEEGVYEVLLHVGGATRLIGTIERNGFPFEWWAREVGQTTRHVTNTRLGAVSKLVRLAGITYPVLVSKFTQGESYTVLLNGYDIGDVKANSAGLYVARAKDDRRLRLAFETPALAAEALVKDAGDSLF